MERRGFLQTLIGGITSAGLLVRATPAEVKAFGATPEQPVILSPTRSTPSAPGVNGVFVRPGETLYNAGGQAVAVVQQVAVSHETVDVTSDRDSYRRYARGLSSVEISAIGLPPR